MPEAKNSYPCSINFHTNNTNRNPASAQSLRSFRSLRSLPYTAFLPAASKEKDWRERPDPKGRDGTERKRNKNKIWLKVNATAEKEMKRYEKEREWRERSEWNAKRKRDRRVPPPLDGRERPEGTGPKGEGGKGMQRDRRERNRPSKASGIFNPFKLLPSQLYGLIPSVYLHVYFMEESRDPVPVPSLRGGRSK